MAVKKIVTISNLSLTGIYYAGGSYFVAAGRKFYERSVGCLIIKNCLKAIEVVLIDCRKDVKKIQCSPPSL